MNQLLHTPRQPFLLTIVGCGSSAFTGTVFGQLSFESHEIGLPAISFAIADFNNDALPDLAVSRNLGDTIEIRLNDGFGSFETAMEFENVGYASGLAAGDLDGDGWADLVWRSNSALRIMYIDSHGAGLIYEIEDARVDFLGPVLADINSDGQLDIIYNYDNDQAIHLILHHARGEYERRTLLERRHKQLPIGSLTTGDLDGDGDLDVISVHADQSWGYGYYNSYYWITKTELEILFNDGHGNVEDSQIIDVGIDNINVEPWNVSAGDLDGDGDIDVVIGANYGNDGRWHDDALLAIFVNDGNGSLTAGPLIDAGKASSHTMPLADIDGDGRLDLVWSQVDRAIGQTALQIRRNLGNLVFDDPQVFPFVNQNRWNLHLGSADLNNDGRIDVLAQAQYFLENTTPYNGPFLEHAPLHRGRPATLKVGAARPDERVHFLYARSTPANSPGIQQLGGITLDLDDPIIRAGSAVADANGTAVFQTTVQPNAPLETITLQAVIRRGQNGADSVKTPFKTTRILE